jgi:hypothetical protein
VKNGKRWPGGVKQKSRRKNARQQARRNEKLAARVGDMAVASKVAAEGMTKMSDTMTKVMEKANQAARSTFMERDVLERANVPKLRELCAAAGIKTTTKTRKGEMIEMLVGR